MYDFMGLLLVLLTLISSSYTFPLESFLTRSAHLPRQESGSTILNNTVRRYYHSSFVLGDTLYIDGGEVTTTNWQLANEINNYTVAIDLSTAFSTDSSAGGSPPNARLIDKGDCPNFNVPAIWVQDSNNTAYIFGGEFSYLNPVPNSNAIPAEELWALTPDNGGSWKKIDQSFDPVFPKITRPAYGAYTYGSIGGFYLGGKYGNHGSPKNPVGGGYNALPGLLFYNFSDHSWANISTSRFYDTGTLERGVAQYVPNWGEKGLLVSVGGNEVTTEGNNYPWSNITIFDPATQEWYTQAASGDAPSSRERFCSVGISSATNDTYEIFIYGGVPLDQQDIAQEASTFYILTLPAFTWFQIRLSSADTRYFQTCNIAGNRQMLSIGGLNAALNSTLGANDTSEQMNTTDAFALGVKVFDLTELDWTNTFDPKAASYEAPKVVKDYYSANARYPQHWNDDRLKDIFTASPQNSTPTSSASPSPTPKGGPKSHTAAIAGGVFGGVAGLALIGAVVWLFCLKKPREQPQGNTGPAVTELHAAQRSELEVPATKERHELEQDHVLEADHQERRWELPSRD